MGHLDDLLNIKNKYNLKEIAVFSQSGQVLDTTQDTDFKVFDVLYGVLGGAAEQISVAHKEDIFGLTLTLENTEFFIYPTGNHVIALEYESNMLNREMLKSIVESIKELYNP